MISRLLGAAVLAAGLGGAVAGAAMAQSQSYAISLGARQVGTLTLDQQVGSARMLSTVTKAPLGLGNGTFEAVVQASGDTVRYIGRSRGRKTRDISFSRQGDYVSVVNVSPKDEATALSDPAAVPSGVISPVEAFAALTKARGCPAPLTIYDGRRVIRMATAARLAGAKGVSCEMSYRVMSGPGHLSPFRFRTIGMRLFYTDEQLALITLNAGGLQVRLSRQ